MAKVTLPPGYCIECYKKTLDKVDLETEAEDKLKELKRKMFTAFMLGDRDGALAEVSYQLGITPGELAVSGPWESPALTAEMARAILSEIHMKYPQEVEYFCERMGIYDAIQKKNERKRREIEMWDRQMMDRNMYGQRFGTPMSQLRPEDKITPQKRDWYVPEYRVKKNER